MLSKKTLAWAAAVLGTIAAVQFLGFASGYPPFGFDVMTFFTAATAVGTILLAVFALYAWRTSRDALNAAEKHSKADLAQRQTARELDALADYLRDLNIVSTMPHVLTTRETNSDTAEESFESDQIYRDFVQGSIIAPIHRSGAIWRLQHYSSEEQLKELLFAEERLVSALWKLLALNNVPRWKAINQVMHWFVNTLSSILSSWQMDAERRSEMSEKAHEIGTILNDRMDDFITEQMASELAIQG